MDEQAATGYDAIKVYNGVSKEEYPTLVNEAKRKKLLLIGHVARGPGYAMTLQKMVGRSVAARISSRRVMTGLGKTYAG